MTNREHCLISLIISTYFFPFIPVLMFSYQYLCFECCLQMAQVCLLLLYSVCVSSFCTHYCPVPWDICVLVHLHLDSLAINRKALIYFILYPSRIILNILLKYNVHIHIENVRYSSLNFHKFNISIQPAPSSRNRLLPVPQKPLSCQSPITIACTKDNHMLTTNSTFQSCCVFVLYISLITQYIFFWIYFFCLICL